MVTPTLMIFISIISRPYQDWLIKFVFISHLFHLINFPFGNINIYTIQELNKFLRLQIFKKGIGIWHLFAIEARPHSLAAVVPLPPSLLNPQAYHIISYSSYISHNNNNNNNNNIDSILTIAYICFSITSLKITVIIKS